MAENNSGNENPERVNHQTVLSGNENDGNLAVSFSETGLEARADFIPPKFGGQMLDKQGVTVILEKINVVYGICWDNIEAALAECTQSRRQVKDVLIAKGEAPENEVAEYYEVNPLLGRNSQPVEASERIDYRARSPFTIVKQGQTLAKLKPGKPGKEGKTIHGVSLPFTVIRPEGVSGGTNTRNEKGLIVSSINGQLIESKKTLNVQETLVIKGAVGYGTGNIVFPGDVMIEGPVSDGFKIFSGGSLTIKQTLDLTEVVTRGHLNVAGGIIGKGTALVKSGGGIRTKFIENCHAAARKSIIVESEIINSTVFTLERIDMADKGMILGGDIYAVQGIRTGGIGKKSGKATRIHCGIDFTAQQEKERCNNRLRILAAKLGKLKELMAEPDIDAEKMAKMEELRNRLEEEQQTVSARISELMGKINTDENAAVEVLGEIVPGTLIEICQIALFVEEPLRKVKIQLDKANGKLVSQPL
ncbi:MAG: FapA family protein [Treponema sp.]|jgi:uncharacterized protein (DUF342 family)|nr:FapA family protein [Treponema sp.]